MPAPAAAAAKPSPLEPFAWLAGCWEGKVNQREFREEWLPLRGEIMVGASQTAMLGKTVSFEFLRLEPRADAVYYIPMPSGRKENAVQVCRHGPPTARTKSSRSRTPATSSRSGSSIAMPPRDSCLRTSAGKVNGEAKEVIYPMRHVDCQTGEVIRK